MAALNPNNTARLWLDYLTCGYNHSVQCRIGTGVLPSDGLDTLADLLDALSPSLYLLTVTGARLAVAGSNVSNPIPWPGEDTYGADVGPDAASANMFDFVGRSNDGRRVRACVFGARYAATSDGNYRSVPGEDAALGAARAVLIGTEGEFVTISGLAPDWKQYTNVGPNAYWRNHIR